MIQLAHGNVLEADTDALVNTVNCVGVMGKGIALQFKNAFPENFQAYEVACRRHAVQPGRMFVFHTGRLYPRYIINFPTKRHWKGKSRIIDIESGLAALVKEVKQLGISSIAVPPLGCGNGGLKWREVGPLIVSAFASLPKVRVLLFQPVGAPAAELMPVRTEKPRMTRARALLLQLIEQYAIPGYRLTLLEIQKLAYFLQAAGENLKFKFRPNKYGPYADNLEHVLQRLEGHYLRGYGDRSRRPGEIRLLPFANEPAKEFLATDSEAEERLKRISQLIEGYETPYGMELLATVHWVVTANPALANDPEAAIAEVQAWSARKSHLFNPEHIRLALDRLRSDNWFSSALSSSTPHALV